MRSRTVLAGVAAVLALPALVSSPAPAALPAAAQGEPPGDRIALPRGFSPEGITAIGRQLYSGSLVGDGIAWARVGDDRATILRDMGPSSVRGMTVDLGTDWLVAVGQRGEAGRLWVVVGHEPGVLATYARFPHAVFPNDVTATRQYLWVTDSGRNVLYRVEAPPRRNFPEVPLPVETVHLTGIPPVADGDIALNGIRALPGGRRLIAVDSRDGTLYAIERESGVAFEVPVTGPETLTSGDGLVLDGRTLYVVRGQGGNEVVRLTLQGSGDELEATDGEVLTSPRLSVPSTAVKLGNSLWLANARFGVDTDRYGLVRLPLP